MRRLLLGLLDWEGELIQIQIIFHQNYQVEDWGALGLIRLLVCFLVCVLTACVNSLKGYIMAQQEVGGGAVAAPNAPAPVDGAGDR